MCGKGFFITTLLVVKNTIIKFSSLCSPYTALEVFIPFKSTLKRVGEYAAAIQQQARVSIAVHESRHLVNS